MGFFYFSLIGLLLSVIFLVIKIIRKEPKKISLILLGIFAVMSVVIGSQPSVDVVKSDYETIMSGDLNGEIIEIKGDVKKIEKVEDLYIVTLVSSDGTYEIVVNEDVPGEFPREGDNRIKAYVTTDWSTVDDNYIWVYAVSFPK